MTRPSSKPRRTTNWRPGSEASIRGSYKMGFTSRRRPGRRREHGGRGTEGSEEGEEDRGPRETRGAKGAAPEGLRDPRREEGRARRLGRSARTGHGRAGGRPTQTTPRARGEGG